MGESSKWEFKAGEMQQQIQEFEKIRRVLTSQLQMVGANSNSNTDPNFSLIKP